MADWLSYSLSDLLMFAPDTYFRLFALYNQDVWPAQVAALAAAVAILVATGIGGARTSRVAWAILACCWLTTAWGFHLERYATLTWVAPSFAAGFALQALLMAWAGALRGRLEIAPRRTIGSIIGLGIVVFAVFGYPLLAPLLGRPWSQAEVFALAPDPTAAATLGLLLLTGGRVAWRVFAVPVAWSAISGATLWAMASPQCVVLPGLAALSLVVAAVRAAGRRRGNAKADVPRSRT